MNVTLMSLRDWRQVPGETRVVYVAGGVRILGVGWRRGARGTLGAWASEAALRDGAGLAFQVVTEARVSDGGQAAGTLGQGPALELGRAELGHDHVHLTAGRGDRA